jgi:hypothetical protein
VFCLSKDTFSGTPLFVFSVAETVAVSAAGAFQLGKERASNHLSSIACLVLSV